MKNTYLHTDLNIKDVDASGKFQPAVPVKSDMAIFQRPEDTQRDIVAIKNETVIALNELSKEIKETRDGVIAFLVSISPEVQEARRRWYRAKPEQTGRVGVYEKWEKADPELLELPTIKEWPRYKPGYLKRKATLIGCNPKGRLEVSMWAV
jgi:hypothetical protein